MLPTAADVVAAADRLFGVVKRTPLLHSPALSLIAGTDVYLKCENVQRTGSFKMRGAYNALATLPAEARARGIVASSAGNHGLGISLSSQILGVPAMIFVPADAPAVKRDGIVALGARIDDTQLQYDDAHDAAVAYADANGMTFVSPCAGAPLLAGQGTVALEILEELPDVRTIVVPVGGGGLVGGTGVVAREFAPEVRIVGAQTNVTNAMAASLAAGHRVEIDTPPTLADGLAGQIDDEGLAIGRFAIDEMCVVSETQLGDAIAWLWREHALRVEGAGAVGLAVVLSPPAAHAQLRGPVAVIISGGNIDESRWRSVVGQQ